MERRDELGEEQAGLPGRFRVLEVVVTRGGAWNGRYVFRDREDMARALRGLNRDGRGAFARCLSQNVRRIGWVPDRVRVWTWANGGAVRLTLHLGDTVEHAEGGPDEEGYHSEGEALSYTFGDVSEGTAGRVGVYCDAWTDGRDCDGRLSSEWRGFAPLELLNVLEPARTVTRRSAPGEVPDPDFEGVRWSEWEEIGASQRDYTAEATGY